MQSRCNANGISSNTQLNANGNAIATAFMKLRASSTDTKKGNASF